MIIAHDLGTTGNKASLHDGRGRLLNSATIRYGTDFGAGGKAEQDPEDWWQAVIRATRELLQTAQIDPQEIQGMIVSGQMMGAVLLDADFRPVRPAIIWADTRSGAQTEELVHSLGMDQGYRITGHQLNPTYSISKVMWVRQNEPEVFARVRHVGLAKDFIVQRLTGHLATDRSDASSTNAYDQHVGTWSPQILQAAGIDPALLPPILESTDVVGTLTQSAADLLGLERGVQVVMGGGDGPLAAVGAGIVAPEDGAYVSLGTSSWISFVSQDPVYDSQMRTMTFNGTVPGTFVPTATMQTGGGAVEWVREVLTPGPDAPELDTLISEAGAVGAATEGLYFLPHLMGERSPHWDPLLSAAFIGAGRHHTRAHLVRAVLEGVAFNLATCIDAFVESGATIDGVDAVGGGANSDTWLQILADVWDIPVRRRSIVAEANSLGAAVTGLVGLGIADSFAIARDLSQVTAEFLPGEASQDYPQRREIFDAGVQALRGWSHERMGT